MKDQKKNVAASIRAKLTDLSRRRGENLQTVLIRFANERFLYRLGQSSYADRFIVKGSTAFAIWFDEPHRPTRDLDLLGFGANNIPAIEKLIGEVCVFDEKRDGLEFRTAI